MTFHVVRDPGGDYHVRISTLSVYRPWRGWAGHAGKVPSYLFRSRFPVPGDTDVSVHGTPEEAESEAKRLELAAEVLDS